MLEKETKSQGQGVLLPVRAAMIENFIFDKEYRRKTFGRLRQRE